MKRPAGCWRYAPMIALLAGQSITVAQAKDPATDNIAIRFGDHPGFGRIVFDVADGAARTVDRKGDRLVVSVGVPAHLTSSSFPRNVRRVATSGALVTIDLTPNASIRKMIIDHHLVIDVLDAKAVPTAAQMAVPSKGKALPAESQINPGATVLSVPAVATLAESPIVAFVPVSPRVVIPKSDPNAVSDAGPATGPSTSLPLQPEFVPTALVAASQAAPDAGPGHLLSVPFAADVGVAAFRRGSSVIVVFDERKPIDLAPLKDDPVFGAASIQLLPAATVLRIPLAAPSELRLARSGRFWRMTAIGGDATPAALQPIMPTEVNHKINLPAAQPGMVVSIPDPETGGVLLVGTLRAPGQAMVTARHAPDFVLLQTWQGIAVETLSDAVALHATDAGFTLGMEGEEGALSSSPPDPAVAAAAEASRMSRLFDLPDLPTGALVRRMQGSIVAAAATPVQSRADARSNVAQSMLALGLGTEAQAVLELAVTSDPRVGEDPFVRAMSAVAALLSGRDTEAAALDDRRLDGTDEITFWRAVRAAQRSESGPAAQNFTNTLPLLLSYPQELQRRLLPLVAETMARGGQVDAARKLVRQRKDDNSLDLARAMIRETEGGDPSDALAQYDRLAQSPDRLIRLRATVRGAELRLASGRATPAETAERLGKMLYAWRGDDREIDLRLRVAELQADATQWRPALRLLRETEQEWPDRRDPIRARLKAIFERSLSPQAQASVSAFDFITLAEENADLMPDGEAGQHLAERISDQLVDLDLPGRAVPFLERMVKSAPPGVAKAAYGGRLAALRLRQADPTGAIDALTSTVTDTLPPTLLESRTLTFAGAVAQQGDFPSAMHALLELDTEAADVKLASLAEGAKNWPAAVTALQRYVRRVVPDAGPLDEAKARIVLRLASAASEAGDGQTLSQLRQQHATRLPAGPTADLFHLLTAQPVRGASDFARGAHDVALARSAPGALAPIASR